MILAIQILLVICIIYALYRGYLLPAILLVGGLLLTQPIEPIRGGNVKSNAIFILCFGKDLYVIGACIAARTHRKFTNLPLVIMCDEGIYEKWNTVLGRYFDRVIKLNMTYFDTQKTGISAPLKYDWLGYSLNKWQCLNFEEYNKVLFVDIDILPCDKKFYEIFNTNTPAAMMIYKLKPIKHCKNGSKYQYDIPNSYDEYIKSLPSQLSIDGGVVLLTPSKQEYQNYMKMAGQLFKDGIYAAPFSGPDELSLSYYYRKQGRSIYNICKNNNVVPWEDKEQLPIANAYNFISFLKPWAKPPNLCWNEELLWHEIFKKMNDSELQELYESCMKETKEKHDKMDPTSRAKYFNSKPPIVKNFGVLDDNKVNHIIS